MKYAFIAAAVLATPLLAFAAVKLTGIDVIKSYDFSGQHITKYQDYDNGIVCYTVQGTNGGSMSSAVSISCVK